MKMITQFRLYAIALAILGVPFTLHAQDVVIDFSQEALACEAPKPGYRALMHAAMFDAVNSIARQYTPYHVQVEAPSGASQEAAAAAAAQKVLAKLCPSSKSGAETLRSTHLDLVKDSTARANGVAVGEKVAAAMLAWRDSAGAELRDRYFPSSTPGVYALPRRETGTGQMTSKPFVMERPSQFRPAAPRGLDTREWVSDFKEIKEVGGQKSKTRTREQTEIGKFWGVHDTPLILRQLASAPGRTLIQNARLYALAEMAYADAYVAMFDGKYTFNFWRPVTAIRDVSVKASGDNNDLAGDPDWEPLIATPQHPEYPCGHCMTAAAIGAVLHAEFGRGQIPTVVIDEKGWMIRRYNSVQQYVDEVAIARIYGGVHYRTSTEIGKDMGRRIGELAVSKYMRPLK